MSKFKNDVQAKDIKLIDDMLQSQPVNELYLKLKHLRDYGGTHKEIESAWMEYCHFRDLYLGFKPLLLQGISKEHRKIIQ